MKKNKQNYLILKKSNKKIFAIALILICMLTGPKNIYTQIYNEAQPLQIESEEIQDSCKVGIYITNLYDFDIRDNSFKVNFWLWYNFENDSLDFTYPAEIDKSKEITFLGANRFEKYGKWNWVTHYYAATIVHDWNVGSYPFDIQHFRFRIEDETYLNSELKYIADKEGSKIDPNVIFNNYVINSFNVFDSSYTYQTSFGNPYLKDNSSFSDLVVEIQIERKKIWITFYKLILGAYVSFFISVLIFFFRSSDVEPKFGLCVGGLFAAIGNKYIVESNVPASASLTLIDQIHNLTFIMILAIVVISMITLNISRQKGKWRLAKRIDRMAFYGITFIYIFFNIMLILAV